MACNVYLALFHHYNTDLLRPLEWKYFLFCYGVPFIPAFVFLFIETNSNGKVYGDAIVSIPQTLLLVEYLPSNLSSNGVGSPNDGAGCRLLYFMPRCGLLLQ